VKSPLPRAAALLLVAACSHGGGAAAPTPGPCASNGPPIGPGVATSLQAADAGSTLCVKVGERFSVYLKASPAEAPWAAVDSSRGGVLVRRPNNQVTLARGTTSALFEAAKPGVTEVSSTRSPCAGPHDGCAADHAWSAVVVVTR
jgi:hypothetical protein